MNVDPVRDCYDSIRRHSKSFAFASRLLPAGVRERAVVVYAWCRRADDAVDLAGPEGAAAALERLRAELDDVYSEHVPADATVALFQRVCRERAIPRDYPRDLLAGMEMDVAGTRYDDMETLLRYCYCVAGTVGLMMCHVMGVGDPAATRNGAHLGIAMQLTNICRDVHEDWERGRLYIPDSVLARVGGAGLADRLGEPFPEAARAPVARATRLLLAEADTYYTSGDAGLRSLSWRCALSVRTARRVYAAIGSRVRAQRCDPLAGRAVVSLPRKLSLASASLAAAALETPRRVLSPPHVTAPRERVRYPGDVLPKEWL